MGIIISYRALIACRLNNIINDKTGVLVEQDIKPLVTVVSDHEFRLRRLAKKYDLPITFYEPYFKCFVKLSELVETRDGGYAFRYQKLKE